MAPPPKTKPPAADARASDGRRDRTSTVVAVTLVMMGALGVVTIFWEPLMALGSPSVAAEARGEGAQEPAATSARHLDAGAPAVVHPDGSGNS
jgi:hypothetical protein